MNVKFIYLYRDGSNFKKWGQIIFSNPDGMPLDKIKEELERAFETDGVFVADQVSVPEIFLYGPGQIDADDHCFHEFAGVEESPDVPSDLLNRTIRKFIREVAAQSERGWTAFDPLERSRSRMFDRQP